MRLKLLAPVGRLAMPAGYWHNPDLSEASPCHLTFDDGPFPETTPYLLELLEAAGIKATFFFMGSNILKHPKLAAMTASAGHEIGNHTHNHFPLPTISDKAFENELDGTNDLILDTTGVVSRVFRPPFGIIDKNKARLVNDRNIQLVYWGAIAEDWHPIGAKETTRRIIAQSKPGTLMVLHESKLLSRQCLSATRMLIEQSKQLGFHFDTITGSVE